MVVEEARRKRLRVIVVEVRVMATMVIALFQA